MATPPPSGDGQNPAYRPAHRHPEPPGLLAGHGGGVAPALHALIADTIRPSFDVLEATGDGAMMRGVRRHNSDGLATVDVSGLLGDLDRWQRPEDLIEPTEGEAQPAGIERWRRLRRP